MASEWAKQLCGCGYCHGGLPKKLNCWADALDGARHQAAEEMREQCARTAVSAYFDCPAEQDVDAYIEREIRALPIEHKGNKESG